MDTQHLVNQKTEIIMKFNKIFLLAGIVSLGLFTSCGDDDDYEPGKPATGQAVNFGSMTQDETMQVKETSFTVDVYRQDTSEAVDIPLEIVRNDTLAGGVEVFQLPSSIHFDNGEDHTSFEVSYPEATIGDYYTLEVKIPEQYAHAYKVNSFKRTIQRDYNWLQFEGMVMDGFLGGQGDVVIEHAEGFNKWRILEPLRWNFYDEEENQFYVDSKYVADKIEFSVNDDGSVEWTSFKYALYDTAEGYIYGTMEGDLSQVWAFRPSELSASLAADDAFTGVDPEDPTVIEFVPYMYIPGLGGFGEKPIDFVIYADDDTTWLTK